MQAGFEFAKRGRRAARFALLAVLAAGLSACGSLNLLGDSGPPPRIYEISPAPVVDSGLPTVSWQLVVGEPYAASAVNTDRIAVRTGAFEFAYYEGVRWSDRAPKMVQTLLVESFENSGKITAVGRQAIGLRSDYELKSDLREFQVHLGAEGGERPLVWVQMNFKLIEQPSAQIVASTTADGRAYAASGKMSAVVKAFDEALAQVMNQVVAWTLKTGQAHDARRKPRRLSEREAP
ncbi:MAG: ABC-type transport auxiliary lipoprotein family protein [Alphaproteobacteria bacterium]